MKKRLFVALPVEGNYSEVLKKFTEQYGQFSWLRSTKEDDLHMTVLFLGEVEEDIIPEIHDALTEIATIQHPFTVKFDTLMYAPLGRKFSMIWAKFTDDLQYGILAGRVREELEYILGTIPSMEPIAHVTLARFSKEAPNQKSLPKLEQLKISEPFVCNKFHLFESKMTPTGNYYKILETFPFQAG